MEKVISKDGTSIAYEKLGKGPALGALCSRAFGPMSKLSQMLAEHFTVYIYDRRGRNQSGDTKPYNMERELEDIDALIKMAGSPVYIAGVSSGAALALEAVAKGLPISKLAMYEPPYVVGAGGHEPPADSKERMMKMLESDKRGAMVKFFMHDMIGMPAFFTAIFPLMPVWSKLKAVAHTLPYDISIMADYRVPAERASSIKIPTFVMGGGKSPVSLKGAVKVVAEAIPNCKMSMLPGQTHNVSNAVLAPELIKFFIN